MSTLFINDIVGTGSYAVPTNDSEMAAVEASLTSLISIGVPLLLYTRCVAWVRSYSTDPATRHLCLMIQEFIYDAEQNPDATAVDAMCTSIRSTLLAVTAIDSVGTIQVDEHLV